MDYKKIKEEQNSLKIDKNFELLDELTDIYNDILNLFKETKINKFDKISDLREKIYMIMVSREIYKFKLNKYTNESR